MSSHIKQTVYNISRILRYLVPHSNVCDQSQIITALVLMKPPAIILLELTYYNHCFPCTSNALIIMTPSLVQWAVILNKMLYYMTTKHTEVMSRRNVCVFYSNISTVRKKELRSDWKKSPSKNKALSENSITSKALQGFIVTGIQTDHMTMTF